MTTSPRRLVVMRHAQAESYAPSDRERHLTEKGTADAAAAGRALARAGLVPDHAVVSAAVRTRETWAAMTSAAGWELVPDLEPALYAAAPENVLDTLRLVPAEVEVLLVLGHNPTVSYLSQLLQGEPGNQEAVLAMASGHPTAAYAVFDVVEEWARLSWGDGRLVDFQVPRA